VMLVTGFAMMGSLFYIPLFVQGVIGSSATNSGLVTMPMMIAMAMASAVSGQLISRFGKYRILGVGGILTMVAGMYMLSRMDVNATMMDARIAMVVFGIGLGASMPLFMLAVQNVVPYKVMGVSTSTIQFLRGVGGVMGVAVMFSLIQSHYQDGLTRELPQGVRDQPQLMSAIKDPQFLLNEQASSRIEQAFLALPQGGAELFQQTIHGVRASLAVGISDAFYISVFIMFIAVAISAFMKEVPLRKVHYVSAEGEFVSDMGDLDDEPEALASPTPALPAIARGANGSVAGGGPSARPWFAPAALAGAVLAVAAAITLRLRR
ncbi:MAG TPA: MFS transporter, partial [Dehalococcoidia bacterium]|nr:MFS transporter [Dehalococcoidia bacterium]